MIQYDIDDDAETVRFTCGGNFSTKRGLVGSPSFPNHYPSDKSCQYTISAPARTFIIITFSVLDITCNELGSDSIEIRDGIKKTSPQMIKDCSDGNRIPKTMQSTHNFLFIK